MYRIIMTSRSRFCTLLLAATLLGCNETQNIHVADYEAWKRLSGGDKAWFPDNLPTSAYDIYATYDLDTSATNIAFQLSPDGVASLKRSLWQLKPQHVIWPPMTVNEPWWPPVLNNRSYDDAKRLGLTFFGYEQKWRKGKIDWGVAIDANGAKAYFWH
jgi:hypothetical protein